jgi:hypothetical protein
MKYRIKETIDGNGDSTFRVQYKLFWWWKNCGHRGEHSKEFAKFWIKSRQTKAVKYHTVEQ